MSYYITKVGIYLQGVYGPYYTRKEALTAFRDAYAKHDFSKYCNDFDGYHEYAIIKELPKDIGKVFSEGGERVQYEGKRHV